MSADREDELLVAQRKINQLKAGGAVAGAGSSGAVGGAGAGAGQPTGSPGAGGSSGGDASDSARLHQLLQKRTAELDEREEALIKAERCACLMFAFFSVRVSCRPGASTAGGIARAS